MSSSFRDAIAKLSTPVKELVDVVTDNGRKYLGETESEQKEVVSWIERSSEIVGEAGLKVRTNLISFISSPLRVGCLAEP